jgi:hypothetical protein
MLLPRQQNRLILFKNDHWGVRLAALFLEITLPTIARAAAYALAPVLVVLGCIYAPQLKLILGSLLRV